jgi:hypothetical protein
VHAAQKRLIHAVLALILAVFGLATAAAAHAETGNGTVVDAQTAPDESAATAIAVKYGHSVVVSSDTTETAQVTALADGTFQLTESTVPVRAQLDGHWVTVDTSLQADSSGMLAPRASASNVEFSNGGAGPMARVQSDDGSWLSETWPGGSLPTPTVTGSTATYAGVYPGVDLALTADPGGMSSVLVVHSAAAAANPDLGAVKFAVSGSTLTASPGTGGAGGAAAATSSNGLVTASPSWWDSSVAGASIGGPGGNDSTAPVPDSVSSNGVTLNVGAVASKPDLTYPVYVDPDWTSWTGGTANRTFVDSAYPTQSYWGGAGASDGCQHVGYINAANSDDGIAHTTRSLWTMDLHVVSGGHVHTASFNTIETWASSTTAREVDVWTTTAISATSPPTWNSQPTWQSNIASATVANGWSSGGNSCPTGNTGSAVNFDVATSVATAAAAGASTITLGLRAASETDWLGWKKFRSAAALVITYDRAPSVPTGLGVGGCAFNCSTQPVMTKDPTLYASSTSPMGNPIRYFYQVFHGHGVADSSTLYVDGILGYGDPGNYQPNLADGDWEYNVRAEDNVLTSDWSPLFKFTVDSVPPALPIVTPTAGDPVSTTPGAPSGTVGVDTEHFTISSAASDHAWGYVYAITPGGGAPTYPSNPTDLTCNTRTGVYTVVCPGTVGVSSVRWLTPVDVTTDLWVWTFDAAGNVHSAGTKITFYANADTTPRSGHRWALDGPLNTAGQQDTATCPQDAVIDDNTSASQSLTLSGGVCWAYDQSWLGGPPVNALSFNGTTAQAATSSGVITTSARFSVAAWVYINDTTSGAVRPVISADGTSDAVLDLQLINGVPRFCVADSMTANPWTGHCAALTSGFTLHTWVFVVGEWDPINQQVRVMADPNGYAATFTAASHLSVPSSTGSIQIGRDDVMTGGGTQVHRYDSGEIYDPVVVQGNLTAGQIALIGAGRPLSAL